MKIRYNRSSPLVYAVSFEFLFSAITMVSQLYAEESLKPGKGHFGEKAILV